MRRGDSYILDSYALGEGAYILVGQDMKVKRVLEIVRSKEPVDETLEGYRDFCYMDYYSYYLESNKSIDSAKIIHSNNYLSFMVKKESLINGKLTEEVIDKHYYWLAHPEEKYKGKKNSLLLYEEVLEQVGTIDLEKLESCLSWIKSNVFRLLEQLQIKIDKGYLKVFFEAEDESLFEKESRRYVLPNVYNTTDYNVVIDHKTYGMPNDNIGLNSKKPYLKHLSRKNSVPYMIDTEEVLLQKKFMDFLMNEAMQGHYNLYFSEEHILGLENRKLLSKKQCKEQGFTGYYLRISRGKEIEIIDSDYILHYSPIIQGFHIKRSIPIDYQGKESNLIYTKVSELSDVARMINTCFFNNFLTQSYFGELPEKLRDETIKAWIIRTREAFVGWFYKGQVQALKQVFPKMSIAIIKNTVMNVEDLSKKYALTRAKEQWLLRVAILTYFEQGGVNMGDQLQEVFKLLEEKVMGEKEAIMISDEEYFCGVGQLAYYLLSHNKGSKKTHALINPILNAKEDKQIKEQLRRLFVKYNYDISQGTGRFNRLYAMITEYCPKGEILEDALLYGYLQDSLLYKKGEKSNDNE